MPSRDTSSPRHPLADLQRLKRFDLNLLLVLRTLLETTSVSETARRLDSTQPSVSRMLERLRDELGDPLLVKTSNTMMRTARAEELRPLLDSMVELLQTVYRSPGSYRLEDEARTCVIGANDSLQAVFAAPLIARLRNLAPRALIRFKPVPYPHPVGALKDGEIDLLLAMSRQDDPGYRMDILFESAFSCLCAKDNARIGARASLDEIASQPYLDVSHMGVISALTESMFQAAGLRRQTVAAMSSFLAAPAVIAHSDMVSLVPSYLGPTLAHHPGVRVVPLVAQAANHTIRMVWHNTTHADPFHGEIRSLVRALSKGLAMLEQSGEDTLSPPI